MVSQSDCNPYRVSLTTPKDAMNDTHGPAKAFTRSVSELATNSDRKPSIVRADSISGLAFGPDRKGESHYRAASIPYSVEEREKRLKAGEEIRHGQRKGMC